jgi:hypothetical protein
MIDLSIELGLLRYSENTGPIFVHRFTALIDSGAWRYRLKKWEHWKRIYGKIDATDQYLGAADTIDNAIMQALDE